MATLPELLHGLASKWREDAPVDQRRSQPDLVSPRTLAFAFPQPASLPEAPAETFTLHICKQQSVFSLLETPAAFAFTAFGNKYLQIAEAAIKRTSYVQQHFAAKN